MEHIVILTRRTAQFPRPTDRLSFVFADGEDEDLDLITDLVDEWNNSDERQTWAEFIPVELATMRHNAEHDYEQHIYNSMTLRRLYRVIPSDVNAVIEYLNLERPLLQLAEI